MSCRIRDTGCECSTVSTRELLEHAHLYHIDSTAADAEESPVWVACTHIMGSSKRKLQFAHDIGAVMLKLAEQLVAQVVETGSRDPTRSIYHSSMSFLFRHFSLSECSPLLLPRSTISSTNPDRPGGVFYSVQSLRILSVTAKIVLRLAFP